MRLGRTTETKSPAALFDQHADVARGVTPNADVALGVTPEWRTAGREVLAFGFALLSSEVDQILGKIFAIGGEEPPPPHLLDAPLATEYRLLIHYRGRVGMEGIDALTLGVVNEDFAFRKRDEMLRERASSVIVEARRVLRGEWGEVVRH